MTQNPLTAVIVEDDTKGAKLLAHILQTYCKEIKILGIANNVESAAIMINKKKPVILFLDIILNNQTCFNLLDVVEYNKLKIIIVSAHNNYAQKAFQYDALDYLLKPLDINDVIATVKKIVQNTIETQYSLESQKLILSQVIGNSYQDFIAVSNMNKITILKHQDIVYLASHGRYTEFYLVEEKKIVASKNIGEYEDILKTYGFTRIHKRFIINLKYLKSIDKTDGGVCLLINNKTLPLASRRKDFILRTLGLK